jgi:hypothetical protein
MPDYSQMMNAFMQMGQDNSMVQPVGGPQGSVPPVQMQRQPLSLGAKSQLMLLAERNGISFPDLVRMVEQAYGQMGK